MINFLRGSTVFAAKKHILFRIPKLFGIAALGCLSAGCIFDATKPVPPLTMQYVGNLGDTVSPMAVLRFAFSDSLTSPLDFDISPPVAQLYEIAFNSSRDTATLSFFEMLPGNTRYILKLKSGVTSKNGATMGTGYDSTVIWTGASEHEPNNTTGTADTLAPPAVYGLLSTASDTDVYCVPSRQKAFYCEAFTNRISLFIKDSLLQNVPLPGDSSGTDTFTVPDGTPFPIHIFVFSFINGAADYYKLGIVGR